MKDITIIYLTTNEMPQHWVRFQIKHLLIAAAGAPIISISKKPFNLGLNILDDWPKKSYWNIYRQIRRGAQKAQTPYIAIAEDDTLYTHTHFYEYRPPDNAVAYDRSRWSLFTWEKEPMYCMRQRISNCSMIGPTKLVVEKLIERERKYPHGRKYAGEIGRPDVEKKLRVSKTKKVEFYSFGPIVQLNHIHGGEPRQQQKWKRHGQMRAYDIPHWGKAKHITEVYFGTAD